MGKGDGILDDKEIERTTIISLSYFYGITSVTSLKGIEYLTALTELGCNDNQLKLR